jgi:hypothetical protein
LEKIDLQEIDRYKNLTSSGYMYENIMDMVKIKTGKAIERKKAKEMVFTVFFSKNDFFDTGAAWLKRLFAAEYPCVYGLFELAKTEFDGADEKQHGRLACLLQSIESEIILNKVCKRVWKEGKQQIPIFTIHDSVVTTVEHKNIVEKIMDEELTECIGVSPKLDAEI